MPIRGETLATQLIPGRSAGVDGGVEVKLDDGVTLWVAVRRN